MRVLTTLLDHKACPARDIAVLYAERWQMGHNSRNSRAVAQTPQHQGLR